MDTALPSEETIRTKEGLDMTAEALYQFLLKVSGCEELKDSLSCFHSIFKTLQGVKVMVSYGNQRYPVTQAILESHRPLLEHIPGCDDSNTPDGTLVAVFGKRENIFLLKTEEENEADAGTTD